MYWKSNKRVKVVSASTAEEFESKLNSALDALNVSVVVLFRFGVERGLR